MSTFRMGCVATAALAVSGALALSGCATMPMKHKAAAAQRMPDKVVLFFHAWSADLTPDAKVIVDQAAAKIKATGPSTVAVAGYVYNDASPDENQQLATKRVKMVQDALVADGIDPKLFLSLPIGAADDSMGQIGDRRVEIRLTY